MKQYSLIIRSAGAAVRVVSMQKDWIAKLRRSIFLRRYIPGYELSESAEKYGATLSLKRGAKNFKIIFPRAVYGNTVFDEKDIVSIAELLLEFLRQRNGIYCMHSSAVTRRGQGVIFWGWASGLGKTRLALDLARRFGFDLFSDEKTLLDLRGGRMIGGVSSAYLSKSYFKKRYKNNFHDFMAQSTGTRIAFLVYPQVMDAKKIFAEKWDNEKLDWHLYEELSRKIRAISRRLFNNTVPVTSLDTANIAEKRSSAVKKFAKLLPCYYMRGTEKQIADRIARLLSGELL